MLAVPVPLTNQHSPPSFVRLVRSSIDAPGAATLSRRVGSPVTVAGPSLRRVQFDAD